MLSTVVSVVITYKMSCGGSNICISAPLSVAWIHCGINDISSTSANAYRLHEIAQNVILCGFKLRESK